MPALENPKDLFQSTCSTNSEPYALQNIGDMMSPEFTENCIVIVDPAMTLHNKAFSIIDFNNELYFRQFIKENGRQLLRCLNTSYPDIELNEHFELRGCIIQQKQRKQKTLHYYLPHEASGEMIFSEKGREKKIKT